MSHPRLCLRTSLGGRAVSGTPDADRYTRGTGPQIPPYPVSRLATTVDDVGEQARSVNLLGFRTRGGVWWGNPLANGQYSFRVAKLRVDKTIGSSLTVLGSCRETGISSWDIWDR